MGLPQIKSTEITISISHLRIISDFLKLFLYIDCVFGSWAVTCQCEHAKCPPLEEEACPKGITQDICGCCKVCAGDVGEECGGPWGIFGTCGEGLECHQDTCPTDVDDAECYLYYLTDPGKCIEARRRTILDFLGGADIRGGSEMKERRRLKVLRQLNVIKK
ncbi:unnamed protein product, partial [Meganyctiphanes norvegica]